MFYRIQQYSLLSVLFFFIFMGVQAQPPGYNFGKQVLIDGTQVSGTTNLVNFPILFRYTNNDLRHTSNGGNVENINGYDIVFYAPDCSTPLNHEIESYDPLTGSLTAWVQVNSLNATSNTGIHLYYGNSSVATDPSTTATWSAGYDGVWHLQNPNTDNSGSGNSGVNNGSSNVSPGFIEDAQGFVDPNHWIELPSHGARGGSFSYTAWFNSSDVTRAGQRIICDDATNGSGCHAISLGDPGSGRVRFYIRGIAPISLDSPNLISNGTWNHVAAVYDAASSTKFLYINGTLVVSSGVGGTLGPANGNASIGGEVASGETGNRFMGSIDEVRSFNGALNGDWIATEYNNQNNPSGFYSVSGQFTASNLCILLPVELMKFEAKPNKKSFVDVTWSTASETNNDYFEVQRSKDGAQFETIGRVEGAGNSNQTLSYEYIDENPRIGISYYRLKQVDFDGQYEYSDIRSVDFSNNVQASVEVHPNPSNGKINIRAEESIRIYDSGGRCVFESSQSNNKDGLEVDVSGWEKGIYLLQSVSGVQKIVIQ